MNCTKLQVIDQAQLLLQAFAVPNDDGDGEDEELARTALLCQEASRG